jgi:hypothetical protein
MGNLAAGVVEGLEDRRSAQEFRVIHHHFRAGRSIKEEIAGDTAHDGRPARDDGEIVGVSEAWDDAIGL